MNEPMSTRAFKGLCLVLIICMIGFAIIAMFTKGSRQNYDIAAMLFMTVTGAILYWIIAGHLKDVERQKERVQDEHRQQLEDNWHS